MDISDFEIGNATYREINIRSSRFNPYIEEYIRNPSDGDGVEDFAKFCEIMGMIQQVEEEMEEREKTSNIVGIGSDGFWCVRVGKIAKSYNIAEKRIKFLDAEMPYLPLDLRDLADKLREATPETHIKEEMLKLWNNYKELENKYNEIKNKKYEPHIVMPKVINSTALEELSHAFGYKHREINHRTRVRISKFFYDVSHQKPTVNLIDV